MSTRHTLPAGLAGILAAGAIPGADSSAPVDPIFAAIEKHKLAWAAYAAAEAKCSPGQVPELLLEASDAASDAECEACAAMHRTVPTTLAGLSAYVTHWRHHMTVEPLGEEVGWQALEAIDKACKSLLSAAGGIGGAA